MFNLGEMLMALPDWGSRKQKAVDIGEDVAEGLDETWLRRLAAAAAASEPGLRPPPPQLVAYAPAPPVQPRPVVRAVGSSPASRAAFDVGELLAGAGQEYLDAEYAPPPMPVRPVAVRPAGISPDAYRAARGAGGETQEAGRMFINREDPGPGLFGKILGLFSSDSPEPVPPPARKAKPAQAQAPSGGNILDDIGSFLGSIANTNPAPAKPKKKTKKKTAR